MFVSLGKRILYPQNNLYYSSVSSNDVTFTFSSSITFPSFRPMTAQSRWSGGDFPVDKSKDMFTRTSPRTSLLVSSPREDRYH